MIRAFAKHDIADVIRLAQKLAQHVNDPVPDLTAEGLGNLAFGERAVFQALVAESAGQVVGFAAFSDLFELHTNSRILHISDLMISDQARHAGLGAALITAMRRIAFDRGCHEIRFEVCRENTEAQGFYAKLGARRTDDVDLWTMPI
ncbi:GNAT family N-acetyltransferase [Rhodovulum sp. FJ3]|uniref:GNAT family N-acetyltransferase n=1 Tax=Rhodovulum sp. FJ3 TaxID=3079053 RepID=UPI00293DE3C5|nr:GNAT family N-acetyltransferase [Rhodovulum sp. FJ3]MDV4168661.1 GNAT family N-acetyltransferase [Rhodovulum sp. FJ3]